MEFLYVKAAHIVFVVTWFCGMFYLGRLFIYNREANDKTEPERSILQRQFMIMIKRLLFGITLPSALVTLFLGLWLLFLYPSFPVWLIIKLCLVFLLFLYQISLHIIFGQQSKNNFLYSSMQLRVWNEVPTVFLVSIVLLVVVKQEISLWYGLLGLSILILILLAGIRLYRKLRSS